MENTASLNASTRPDSKRWAMGWGSGCAPRILAQQPSARAITICCTSSVPSPIVRILASR